MSTDVTTTDSDLAQMCGVLRDAAVTAVAAGFCVFPVEPGGKVPALRNWEHEASREPGMIRRWWAERPYNVGLATGRSGLVVVDLDDGRGSPAPEPFTAARHGRDVLAQLAREAGEAVPVDTFTVATPRNGEHLYFAAPPGVELRNSQGRLGWRIDTRGHGGLVVAAGSMGPDGRYRVTRRAPVRPLPDWLVPLLQPPPPAPQPDVPALRLPDGRADRYLRAIVAAEAATLAAAPAGTRHTALLTAGRTLGRLVGGGELDRSAAFAALHGAAVAHLDGRCDCTPDGIARTLDDALGYGARRPRRLRREQAPSHSGRTMADQATCSRS